MRGLHRVIEDQGRFLTPLICLVTLLFITAACLGIETEAERDLTSSPSLHQQIIHLVNKARSAGRKCGTVFSRPAQPITWNDRLGKAALNHATDMAEHGFLSHRGSDSRGPSDRITGEGYRWSAWGENIGVGYRTPQEAVAGWLASEPHCRTIMDPDYREAGAASSGNRYGKTSWVVVFASPDLPP